MKEECKSKSIDKDKDEDVHTLIEKWIANPSSDLLSAFPRKTKVVDDL